MFIFSSNNNISLQCHFFNLKHWKRIGLPQKPIEYIFTKFKVTDVHITGSENSPSHERLIEANFPVFLRLAPRVLLGTWHHLSGRTCRLMEVRLYLEYSHLCPEWKEVELCTGHSAGGKLNSR